MFTPKQVYAARGDTYVGWVPMAHELLQLESLINFGPSNARIYSTFPAINTIAGLALDYETLGHLCETYLTYAHGSPHHVYNFGVQNMPRWQMFFLDTVRTHQNNLGNIHKNSFYIFDEFTINDNPEGVWWSKFMRKSTWRLLENLEDLPGE